jgi:hypothetical protein
LDYEKVEKNMKLKITLVSILLGCVSSVHATLIDITPGGFNWNNAPQVVNDWYQDVRPGLFLFDDSFFTITGLGTPTVTFSWDFRGTPAIFQWVFADNIVNGNSFGNFYQVPWSQRKVGEASITIDGELPVTNIVPFGRSPYRIPETGTTMFLFLIGSAGLGVFSLVNKHKTTRTLTPFRTFALFR